MYDIAIIGGGVCGAAVAYFLSGYRLKCCVIEKENDVACGTTKANSGIVHAGYDPEPGTLMARLNLRGSELCGEICRKYGVPYKKTGSLVLAFGEKDSEHLQKLYKRGLANGVKGLSLLSKQETLALEPNLSEAVTGSLLAESAAVVNPWRLCLAMCEAAAYNGVEFLLGHPVRAIGKTDAGFEITAGNEIIASKYVVNAAGVYADKIAALAGACDFAISPSKGQYYLLDKTQRGLVGKVVFQCPTDKGKGVLVSPTADGNIIVGPNAEADNAKDDVSTTRDGLDYVAELAALSVPHINYRDNIRSFAGLRANSTSGDFIIGESKLCKNFINVAGIKSPGLSSAPAIGEYVTELLRETGAVLEKKESFEEPPVMPRFAELGSEEKKALCLQNPAYGNIICRCNTISEGEILDALKCKIKPRTLDAIKRRTGTGMGRCQGGFCGPRVHEILCRYYGVNAEDIVLDRDGSYIVSGKVGENK